jgi:hypothetical protein
MPGLHIVEAGKVQRHYQIGPSGTFTSSSFENEQFVEILFLAAAVNDVMEGIIVLRRKCVIGVYRHCSYFPPVDSTCFSIDLVWKQGPYRLRPGPKRLRAVERARQEPVSTNGSDGMKVGFFSE